MKKVLLLAGVAALVSANANAFNLEREVKPYIGADYTYSNVEYKTTGYSLPHSYNSHGANIGAKLGEYFGPEFYYQQSFKRTTHTADKKVKNRFFSYGMDLMGYLPLGCEGMFNGLASVGFGDYNVKTSYRGHSNDTNKIGYRAGLGLQYNMTDNWSARIMGRYSYVGTRFLDDMWEAVAGLRYTF